MPFATYDARCISGVSCHATYGTIGCHSYTERTYCIPLRFLTVLKKITIGEINREILESRCSSFGVLLYFYTKEIAATCGRDNLYIATVNIERVCRVGVGVLQCLTTVKAVV